jgi:beta-glucanase (GH16 family)
LGANISSIGWPACGEVDVMENNGGALGNVQGSLHSGSDETAVYTLPDNGSVTNFHAYTLDWATNAFLFYVDGRLYETQTNWSSSAGGYPTPFNQPFFIIMNLAVGGDYLGNPTPEMINTNSTFPGEMQVDYVRIYHNTGPLRLEVTNAGAAVFLSWPTNIVCHLQSQTNLPVGLGANWVDLSVSRSPYVVTASPAQSVFYRLSSP